MTVGCVIFSVATAHPQSLRLNGVSPTSSSWKRIYLKQVARNEFELPDVKVEFTPGRGDEILCVSVKAWLNEATNQYDGMYYQHLDDRYALLSWCSRPPEAFAQTEFKARFGQNRVESLDEFKLALSRPFPIRLNDKPLREEWGRYPMINPLPPRLSDAELKAIEQVVRDRGERFVSSISIANPDHATVMVGDQDMFHTARIYELTCKQGTWQIQSSRKAEE